MGQLKLNIQMKHSFEGNIYIISEIDYIACLFVYLRFGMHTSVVNMDLGHRLGKWKVLIHLMQVQIIGVRRLMQLDSI